MLNICVVKYVRVMKLSLYMYCITCVSLLVFNINILVHVFVGKVNTCICFYVTVCTV